MLPVKTEVSLTDKPQTEDDFFRLGFHGAYSEGQLRAMSYVSLCSELESASTGTTKYMLLESEKRSRDSVPTEKPSAKPTNKPGPDHWYKERIPVIVIAVIGGCLVLGIRYVLRKHFNLDV